MNFQPRLFREARASGWLFPMAVVSAFVAGGLAIYQSYQLSRVISGVFLDTRTLAQVTPLLRLILFVVLLRALFTYLNEMLAGRLAVTVKLRLRTMLLEKIDRLGPEFLKNETTAELTTIALQGVDALNAYFAQYLPQVLIAVILPLTILIVVFPLDLVTGIVFFLTAPLIPLFMVLIGKAVESLTGRQWRALTRLGNYFLDTLQGIATLKLLGRNRFEEFDSESKRLQEMSTQKLDLEKSLDQILETIQTINATSSERFTNAFVAINAAFAQVFQRLFGGGTASMQLLDESDPLDSGIEIMAQPPGKRNQTIGLLSGGEKALTAVALLVSIFRYKPSPFCILDEVDAPLDEANIDRFTALLNELSEETQFVLITHSKRTMETAQALYGVTQEEPGVSKIVSVRFD